MSIRKVAITLSLLVLALALAGAAGAAPPPQLVAEPAAVEATMAGNTITYQGYLTDGGMPANGIYDFTFGLYADALGSQWVTTGTGGANLPVTNGYFTAQVDFGDPMYGDIHFYLNGEARWLRIGVRPGDSTGAYTYLTPLQALTPAPYAQALPGLHTIQNATSPNVVGGYPWNSVNVNAVGATISGGGSDGATNSVNASYGTVGGGYDNLAGGQYATVPGGRTNEAVGNYSLAAGRQAKANHEGSFVWADATGADLTSTMANQFLVRATSGTSIYADNTAFGLRVDNDDTAGNGDGMRVFGSHTTDLNWAAVYAINNGTSPALYGNSAGTYSAYFADSIYVVGSCVGCTTAFLARNDGAEPLEAGDLVVATGVTSLAGNDNSVLRVRRAGADASPQQAVAGVVQGRGVVVTSAPKETARDGAPDAGPVEGLQQADGPAVPGDYLFVVVQGIARVKVDASAGPIVAGQRLASASQAGYARALRTVTVEGLPVAEGVPTLGIALEPLEAGTGLISVLVNLQ